MIPPPLWTLVPKSRSSLLRDYACTSYRCGANSPFMMSRRVLTPLLNNVLTMKEDFYGSHCFNRDRGNCPGVGVFCALRTARSAAIRARRDFYPRTVDRRTGAGPVLGAAHHYSYD